MTRNASEHLDKNSWMSKVHDIDKLRLTDIIWPGAHNAGMDKKAPNYEVVFGNWTTCQNDSFAWQLSQGARVLDLRIGYRQAIDQSIFYFHHDGFQSHRVLDDLIDAVLAFLDSYADEFLILDFHQLGDGDTPFDYQLLGVILLNRLGPRLINWEDAGKSVGELKKASLLRRVVVSVPLKPGLESYYFWPKIPHKWSGKGVTDTEELERFITKTLEGSPNAAFLWSLSATTYSRLGGPQHIASRINDWFSTTRHWISRCSIINTDFFEESDIVRYCWSATSIKAIYGDTVRTSP